MRKVLLCLITIHFLLQGCINSNQDSRTSRYYINSLSGNDANNGISVKSPWKSLEKFEEIVFQPGDSILFAGNSTFEGGIAFNSSGNTERPIVISSYGEGSLPSFSNPDQNHLNGNVFQVSGSHIVIDGLSFSKCADANSKNGKSILETGAIFTQTDADSITIKNCEFTDCSARKIPSDEIRKSTIRTKNRGTKGVSCIISPKNLIIPGMFGIMRNLLRFFRLVTRTTVSPGRL